MNGTTRILAFCLVVALAGCGSARLFEERGLPESPAVADAPWPRLVETPDAPPQGSYSEDVPDPARGVATVVQLGEAARTAATRAEALEEPALTEAERARLLRAR